MKLFDGTHPDVEIPTFQERPGFRAVVMYHAVMPNKIRVRFVRDGHPTPATPEGWIMIANPN